MADPSSGAFGFGKFVPGFDFLQNLAKGASDAMPQMPKLSSWVAPTLNVEELDKRISELKAVQFWLEQNGKALQATIQALEVQKMTLATLRGMNVSMGELAEALKVKPQPASAKPARARPGAESRPAAGSGEAGAAPVDPLQWWGALTQQFQEIAANAMKDAAETARAATAAAQPPAGTPARPAAKTGKAAKAAAPRKPAARKSKGPGA